ncbi:MAG: hypothetical protein COA66_10195 [Arcobacter sp.]|nr:MAG: hypothetical protein COA66_10195 [Arcobacter sp.]
MKINPLKTGIIGSIIMALCCFTPILVVIVTAVGLSAIIGYLDYVLFPALGFFVLLTIYALSKRSGNCCDNNDKSLDK